MKENEKLIDAIIDLSQKVKRLGNDLGGLSQEMKGMRKEQQETNKRLEKLEKQQEKTNLHLAEHSRSIMILAEKQDATNTRLDRTIESLDKTNVKLGETNAKLDKTNVRLGETNVSLEGLSANFNKYAKANDARAGGHEKRIVQLEDAISDNGGKRMFMVKEPEAKYKMKKKQVKSKK